MNTIGNESDLDLDRWTRAEISGPYLKPDLEHKPLISHLIQFDLFILHYNYKQIRTVLNVKIEKMRFSKWPVIIRTSAILEFSIQSSRPLCRMSSQHNGTVFQIS